HWWLAVAPEGVAEQGTLDDAELVRALRGGSVRYDHAARAQAVEMDAYRLSLRKRPRRQRGSGFRCIDNGYVGRLGETVRQGLDGGALGSGSRSVCLRTLQRRVLRPIFVQPGYRAFDETH